MHLLSWFFTKCHYVKTDDINAEYVENNGGGGATGQFIDGTVITETTVRSPFLDAGVVVDVYKVKNNCGLYIGYVGNIKKTNELWFFVNRKSILTFATSDIPKEATGYKEEAQGTIIPMKKGTQISAVVSSVKDINCDLSFIEYKMV